MKKIFIIHPVRNEDPKKYLDYAQKLESDGYVVYLPVRDTNQNNNSIGICSENRKAMADADEVHIFFNGESQGSFFDLGMCFAMEKKLKVIESLPLTEHKSFQNFIEKYAQYGIK